MTARQPLDASRDASHHRPGGGLTSRERTKVLVSVCASLALVVSAVASLNIALPDLAARTGASQTELQWIVDAYALVFAGLLLIAGAVGDKYGRKHTLVAGLVVFGAAYAFGATVDSPTLLVAARAVAGVGAALAMPSTLSVLTTSFAPAERAKAVGTWAGVAGAGAVLGLLLSGILIEVGDWPWVFTANAVWAATALVLVVAWVPRSRDTDHHALDVVGALLSAVGLASVIFATIEGPGRGWSDGLVVGGYLAGAVLLSAFVLWELRAAHPMLDPRLFRLRGFRTGTTSMTLQFFALFGFMFATLQYLQLVRDYSALEAALALIPLAITVGALSRVVAPRLIGRFGHRRVDAAGLAVLAGGFGVLSTLDVNSSYLHLLAGLVPMAAGIGMATTPATASIVESLPASKQGVASAVNDTAREVGGAVGIAVLGSVLNDGYRDGIAAHAAQLPPEGAERARESLAFVAGAAEQFGPAGEQLLAAGRQAFVDGFNTAMVVAAVVVACGALVVLGRGRRSPATHEPGAPGHAGGAAAPAPADRADAEHAGADRSGRSLAVRRR
ncbi:MAG: MFS transporter [Acidimicrobiales bacterium]|nr:MFS transporter [Acidimicrobiales bacterium]